MTRTFRILALATAGAMLAGCSGGVQESLGLKKKAPDEFAVVRNAPLSLPPKHHLLNDIAIIFRQKCTLFIDLAADIGINICCAKVSQQCAFSRCRDRRAGNLGSASAS